MHSIVFDAGRALAAGNGLRWADKDAAYGAMLLGGGYHPSQRHRTVAEIASYEVSARGYRRQLLTNRGIGSAEGVDALVADNICWAGLDGIDVTSWLVVYAEGASDLERTLLAAYPFTVVTHGRVEVRWDDSEHRGAVLRLQ